MKTLSYAAFLFLFWLLLSGHLSHLMLSLGLVSVISAIILMKRMKLFDHESYPLHLWSKMPAFLIFLMREIVKANIDVIKRILSLRSDAISPKMVEIQPDLKTDLGRVLHANAITLTPGTVSVELTSDRVLVHALSKEAAEELSTGDMAKAVPDIPVKWRGE